ncbi:hypothetical protein BZA77DRAFT_84059 [Pyronema omphalodes]|nr:hypothetical protein BZA77DRAFT_84059 [Pyronema omphalodes]
MSSSSKKKNPLNWLQDKLGNNKKASNELPPTYSEATRDEKAPTSPHEKEPISPISEPSKKSKDPQSNNPFRNKPATEASNTNNGEEDFAILGWVDTMFLIDDSASMLMHWDATRAAVHSIVDVCHKYDSDGVDVRFLNNPTESKITPHEVEKLFLQDVKPTGPTPTAKRLGTILREYVARFEKDFSTKPLNIICFTDGRPFPEEPEETIKVITDAAKDLNRLEARAWQIGIQFFQIGTDKGARDFLRNLDDNLAGGAAGRDMVDTAAWENIKIPGKDGRPDTISRDAVLKVVIGSISKHWDQQNDPL